MGIASFRMPSVVAAVFTLFSVFVAAPVVVVTILSSQLALCSIHKLGGVSEATGEVD
jgi:hypothetical protein